MVVALTPVQVEEVIIIEVVVVGKVEQKVVDILVVTIMGEEGHVSKELLETD